MCEPGAAANGAGTLLSGARRLHRADGTPVHHHLGVSGFAEYATVSRRSLVKIDPELPLDEAALFGCAVLTGVGAVVNTARVPAGASVAVIGLGGVGLCSLLGAIAAGAREIVAIDLADDKLAFARQLGATATFNARDPDCADQVRSATGGGVEYAFELAGSVQGAGARLPDHPPRRHHGDRRPAAADRRPCRCRPVSLVAEERTLKGSYIGTAVPSRDIPRYIELYQRGRLPVDRLMSGDLTLDEINQGFDRLHEGKAIRQVVCCEEASR